MKLYRAMTPAEDGLPEVGRSARKLGVRAADRAPNNDVDASVGADVVQPGKGVSVAPNDPANLPKNRRPRQLNGGTGPDPVWEIDVDDLGPDLQFVQDKPTHGAITPARPVTLDEYETALGRTRTKWVRYIG